MKIIDVLDDNLPHILGGVRHALTTLGGGLVTAGVLSDGELATAAGAVATLIGVAWSVFLSPEKGDEKAWRREKREIRRANRGD